MNKRVLLTGATGFLGSHLLEAFISKGFEVSIIRRSTSNTFRIDFLTDQYRSYNSDEKNLDEIFEVVKPEIVVHTACSYGRNSETTLEVLSTNLFFALELLKVSVAHKVATFINTDTLLPREINDYSLSKGQFREWLEKESRIQVVNLKLEHVYGPRDDARKFLVWLVDHFRNNENVDLTSGLQKRDFIYVDDVVSSFLCVLESDLPRFSEFEVGTGQSVQVKEFVLMVKKQFDSLDVPSLSKLNFGSLTYRNGEIMKFNLDISPLRLLGWEPKVSLQEGIELYLKSIQ